MARKKKKKIPSRTRPAASSWLTDHPPNPEQLRAAGVHLSDFVEFLQARKAWEKYRYFLVATDHPVFVYKTENFLFRVLKKRHPELHAWNDLKVLPRPGTALTPILYRIRVDVSSLSRAQLAHLAEILLQSRSDIFWLFTELPPYSDSIWKKLAPHAWIIRQPVPAPPDFARWVLQLARAFRLQMERRVAEQLSIAVLYDPLPLFQAFENLALVQPGMALRWVDIEPYLPAELKMFSGSEIFQWLVRKNYDNLLRVIEQLADQKPHLGTVLRQGYDQWRRWVLMERGERIDPRTIRRDWGLPASFTAPRSRRSGGLAPLQLHQWTVIASELEIQQRKGDLDPATCLAVAMLRWLRVIA